MTAHPDADLIGWEWETPDGTCRVIAVGSEKLPDFLRCQISRPEGVSFCLLLNSTVRRERAIALAERGVNP